MDNIDIKGYKDEYFIPTVNFDSQTGICEITGESYLDDSAAFYTPILDWIDQYMTENKKPIIVNFRLTYFNTSSSKRIYQIMSKLKKYESLGANVTVNWYFRKEDEDLVEEINDMMSNTELKINYLIS